MKNDQRKRKARQAAGKAGIARCLLLFLLLSAALLPAFGAAGVPVFADTSGSSAYVTDSQELLTREEAYQLAEACGEFAEKYDCNIFFVSAGDQQIGENHTEEDDQTYLENFNEQNFGAGSDSVGLLIDMDLRYYYIDIMGDQALQVFTDQKQAKLRDAVEEELAQGNYAQAAFTFVDKADYWYGRNPKSGSYVMWTLISIGVAALIVFFWYRSAAAKHKEQHVSAEAAAYVRPNSFRLSVRQDRFLRTYVTRVAKPKNDGGGGTSTHSSGSGTSHSGGGGHF